MLKRSVLDMDSVEEEKLVGSLEDPEDGEGGEECTVIVVRHIQKTLQWYISFDSVYTFSNQ